MEPNSLEFVARLLVLPLAMTIDPFATLLVFGICLRAGWIIDPILTRPEFSGFASPEFLTVAGVLYVAHAAADKIPPIGHLFDGLGLILKPLAAAMVGLWLANKLAPESALHWYAMAVVVLGGIPAVAGLQLARTKIRFAASASSFGTLHPVASTAENLVALPIAFLSVLRPELALLFMAVIGVPLLWLLLKAVSLLGRGVKRVRSGLARRTTPPSQHAPPRS